MSSSNIQTCASHGYFVNAYTNLHPHCDAVFPPFGKKDLLDISGSFCNLAAHFDDWMLSSLKSIQMTSDDKNIYEISELSAYSKRSLSWHHPEISRTRSYPFFLHCISLLDARAIADSMIEIFLARWTCFFLQAAGLGFANFWWITISTVNFWLPRSVIKKCSSNARAWILFRSYNI